MSDTKCALEGDDPEVLDGGSTSTGLMLLGLLVNEVLTEGLNGDMSTLIDLGPQPAPGPYTCELFNDPETVCEPFWVSHLSIPFRKATIANVA